MSLLISNCRCGELVIQAPQERLDGLVKQCEAAGYEVQRASATPEPSSIPTTTWNFGNEQADEQQQDGPKFIYNGDGLPQTDWEAIFNADAATPHKPAQQQQKNRNGGPTPLGQPVWNW